MQIIFCFPSVLCCKAASLLRSHFQTPITCDPTEGLPCLNASSASADTVDGQSSILPKKR